MKILPALKYLLLASLPVCFFQSCLQSSEPGPWIPSPFDRAVDQPSDRLELGWHIPAVEGNAGVSFQLYVDTVNPPIKEMRIEGHSQMLILESLEPGSTYFWQVDYRIGEEVVQGPVWRFSVNPSLCLRASDYAAKAHIYSVHTFGGSFGYGNSFSGERRMAVGKVEDNLYRFSYAITGTSASHPYNSPVTSTYSESFNPDASELVLSFKDAYAFAASALKGQSPRFAVDGCLMKGDTSFVLPNAAVQDSSFGDSVSISVNRQRVLLLRKVRGYKQSGYISAEYSFKNGLRRFEDVFNGFQGITASIILESNDPE